MQDYSDLYLEIYESARKLGYSRRTARLCAGVIADVCVKFGLRLDDLTPRKMERLALEAGYSFGVISSIRECLRRILRAHPRSRSLVLLRIFEILKARAEEGLTQFRVEDLHISRQRRHTVWRVLRELEEEGYLKLRGKSWIITEKMLALLGLQRKSHKFHEIPPRGPERAQMCEIEG